MSSIPPSTVRNFVPGTYVYPTWKPSVRRRYEAGKGTSPLGSLPEIRISLSVPAMRLRQNRLGVTEGVSPPATADPSTLNANLSHGTTEDQPCRAIPGPPAGTPPLATVLVVWGAAFPRSSDQTRLSFHVPLVRRGTTGRRGALMLPESSVWTYRFARIAPGPCRWCGLRCTGTSGLTSFIAVPATSARAGA
jgi:hypothetical protein